MERRQARGEEHHLFGSDAFSKIEHDPGGTGFQAMKAKPLLGLRMGNQFRQAFELLLDGAQTLSERSIIAERRRPLDW